MTFKHCTAIIVLVFSAFLLNAQGNKAPENWFTLDPVKDQVNGTGSDEALQRLKAKGKKGQTIIVAVLDSGVDYEHEDLKDIMWVNPGEIPGNNIDDDGNGYVDDIHGWNFLGGKDGKSVHHETLELTREYVRLSKRFKGTDPKNLHGPAAEEYKYYEQIKEAYEEQRGDAEAGVANIEKQLAKIEEAYDAVEKATGKKNYTDEDIAKIEEGASADLQQSIGIVKAMKAQGIDSRADFDVQKKEATEYFDNQLQYNLNPDYNPRDIVGDNPNDLNNRIYGNNDYEGPDAFHGTHVAGIIAAVR
ncbi:MAG: S8 family serine peptidase, partial [Saprospiraceae bacterium]|nr:S8 family serine peptidase [Saprospiraceae bacterium]